MAKLDVPGIEIKWHKDGEYMLPDSSNALSFDLVIIDPKKLIGWFIKQEWRNLSWRERIMALLVWVIAAMKGIKGRL